MNFNFLIKKIILSMNELNLFSVSFLILLSVNENSFFNLFFLSVSMDEFKKNFFNQSSFFHSSNSSNFFFTASFTFCIF